MRKKILISLSVVFILFMVSLFIIYLVKGDFPRMMLSLGGAIVSALPLFLIIKLKPIPFNIPLIIGYYIFVFCTIFLGSIAGFYIDFQWWDTTIHFYKGIFLVFVGVVLFREMISNHARINVSRWIFFLFVFSLSVTASVIWEVYEFLGDIAFTHGNMQMGGNTDTMIDLIFGTIGALITAVYAVLLKKNLD